MTYREYWEILRRSWLLVATTTLVGLLAALGLSMVTTPIYQAEAQLFISVQTTEEIAGAYTAGLYVQQRIDSYASLVDTPGVLEPVIDELELDETPAELSPQVSARNQTGTVLINVLATDVDAEQAARIADATAESLAAEIVRLETTESGSKPVQAELIKPAPVPGAPISPRTVINIVLGSLLGLLAGAAIAVLRAIRDTSIKSVEALQDATAVPLLGTVTHDPRATRSPLAMLKASPRTESYRRIRTNLRYVEVDDPPRCVVITSPLPMEGKSTTAVNLAIALAQGGSRVLLVEADLRRPKIAEYLGVDGSIGLTDVLIGRAASDEVIIPWQRGLLDFLPSGAIPPNPSELLGSQQLADLLTRLTSIYDVLIVDAPPVLPVTDAAILTAVADGAILVVRYGKARRDQVEKATAALSQVGGHLIGTILTFVPERRQARTYDYDYSQPAKGRGNAQPRPLTEAEVSAPPTPA